MQDSLGLTGILLADKYRLERLVGEGGAGWVYFARNRFLDQAVAVKVLKTEEATSQASAEELLEHSFMKEAKLLFSLSHPNIVRVYDAGQAAVPDSAGHMRRLPYVVFEYIDGTALDAEVKARRDGGRAFALSEIAVVLSGALSAVAFAHRTGVVHRDIKPSNLMITSDGVTKILDFGTARTTTQATRLTTHFTPRYAAPEQWDPSRGPRGPWTDVYSLGLILYELATLELAAPGEDLPTLIANVMAPERPSFLAKRPDLAPLAAVLQKAIALDHAARYPSGVELALAFDEAVLRAQELATRPVMAMTSNLPQRPALLEGKATVPIGGALQQLRAKQSTAQMVARPPRTLGGTLPLGNQNASQYLPKRAAAQASAESEQSGAGQFGVEQARSGSLARCIVAGVVLFLLVICLAAFIVFLSRR
jgi:eukaryotic-like serine/threonine-protein kinase